MKSNIYILLFITLLLIPFGLLAQSKIEIEETYRDANSYFFFEDYEEALALYQRIYRHQPENYNLNFRIGFCYLNILGSKHLAIPYLEKAVKNTTRIYNEESIAEQRAPIDAFFYLGNAYLVNNRIDDALKAYNKFYEQTKGKGNWDFEYFSHQVNVAKNSQNLQRNPVNFIIANLGEGINDRFSNFNAVVSGDGNVLAYTTKQKFYNAINVSREKTSGEWEKPVNITLDLAVDGNCTTLCLSYEGTELYLFKDDQQDGNIYVSHFNGKKWSPISKINSNVNTKAYEVHACLSPDGKQLYFSSNRKGGYGGLDIWVCTRSSDNNWGPARNLGPTINTPFNETAPFFSANGTSLFFSSEGHNNMGGYDVFVTQSDGKGEWLTPINLGYPINTTDDDLFFHPLGDGSKGLIARFDESSYGELDIFEVEFFIPRFKKSIVPSNLAQERLSDKSFDWMVVDTISQKGVAEIDPKQSSINLFNISSKNYTLFLNGKRFPLLEKKEDIAPVNSEIASIEKKEEEPQKIDIPPKKHLIIQKANLQIDTNPFGDTENLKPVWPTDSPSIIKPQDVQILNDEQYLSEILLMITPPEKQKFIIPILKKNWNFSQSIQNENIIKFATSFNTIESKLTILPALSKLYDKISTTSDKNRASIAHKKLSQHNQPVFYKSYNELINKVSNQLAQDLTQIMLKNNITSLTELFEKYRKENSEGFNRNIDELLVLLSQMAINSYMVLSPDQKTVLYNTYNEPTLLISKNSKMIWLILAIIAIVGVIIMVYWGKIKRIKR